MMKESPMGQQLHRSQSAPITNNEQPSRTSPVLSDQNGIKSLQEKLVKREITFEQYIALKSAL
jgi:hypothetical protein